MNVLGMVCPRTGQFFAIEASHSDTELFQAFLDEAKKTIKFQRAKKHEGRHENCIEVMVAGANALPFADKTFDRILSTGSLHHWKDPIHAMTEAHRVLKDDGYALMYDMVRDMPKAVFEQFHAQFGCFRLAPLWLHSFEEPFLAAEEMEALRRQSDFAVEGTRFTGVLCCLVLRKI